MSIVDEVIDSWGNRPIKQRYFRGDERIKLTLSDYLTRSYRPDSNLDLPEKILFIPDYTNYALILQATGKKDLTIDSALVGFNVPDSYLDCLEFHGGNGRYRELTPVLWDRALLGTAIDFAKEAELDAVCVIPSNMVEGSDCRNMERIIKRYDENAKAHYMNFSKGLNRFIIEI